MGRNNLTRLRRVEYSKSAFETLSELGLSGTTVDKVAERAGTSKTNILHYFGSKAQLLEMAMRYAHADFAKDVRELLVRSATPWERVYSVVEGNFSRAYFKPRVAHAWLALCAEVPYRSAYQRIQTATHKRTASNLIHALDRVTDRETACQTAFSLSVMIDGLWVRCGTTPAGISRDTSIEHISHYLESVFPGDAERTAAKVRIAEINSILNPH
ncbi:transcriptional regulator BetI [Ruegeria arenilitoris]|uniref:transcriptional regulator BetI n=1 Tax=Ruegeria arenilitoris TaxID=1173585 RepID=UPI00147A9C2C|nr:transcriptional regulator BetI [Ruegeria arenilitoris]